MDQEAPTMDRNQQLQQRVMEALAWEPKVHATQIGVSVDSGLVMLSGIVHSYAEKWAAGRAAERVKGVRALMDEITVNLSDEFQRGDLEIARAAINTLEWDAMVPRDRIKVIVQEGWITLDGIVDLNFQKVEAENVVANLLGVKGVTNRIEVSALVSPRNIKREIKKALERSAKVDPKAVSVELDGTRVILSGVVKSWRERKEAERAAWAAPGISNVENKIEIAA
jgi:osmotically-inducible protein OsmY